MEQHLFPSSFVGTFQSAISYSTLARLTIDRFAGTTVILFAISFANGKFWKFDSKRTRRTREITGSFHDSFNLLVYTRREFNNEPRAARDDSPRSSSRAISSTMPWLRVLSERAHTMASCLAMPASPANSAKDYQAAGTLSPL